MNEVKVAQDFMRRRLVTLSPHTKVLDGVARLLRDNISGAPVVDDQGQYIGVFSEKACMRAMSGPMAAALELGISAPKVREFMKRDLITLSRDDDVFQSIDHILSKRISGAPVVDERGNFLGIFSEKTAMRVLVAAIYDQVPGTSVGSYMNLDRNRIIDENDCLHDVAEKFEQTPYRRLPILHGERLAGQVSRRDVLRAQHRIAVEVADRIRRGGASDSVKQSAREQQVGEFADTAALTLGPNADILQIAQLFLNSPYRRVPIVSGGRLVGQISRRDLLEAAADLLRPDPERHKASPLYLSPLADSLPPSMR
ncbi:CBS domain-containing protein [Rhodopirellula sp. JC639]|uniref:CBS domain-containing protein n=1 Tax=Stieleria mannarensis TaxID=2755585 RepID=UPI00160247F8|nr:CBS domain-containing protein [Rhodopirellula sp. JC639]